MQRSLLVLAVALVFVAPHSLVAAAGAPAWSRWRIFHDGSDDCVKIADAVAAQLGKLPGMQTQGPGPLALIKKDKDAAATNADKAAMPEGLIVLERGTEDAQFRATLVDCRSGARLDLLNLADGVPVTAAAKVVKSVGTLRERYPRGIVRLFMAPRFINRSLAVEANEPDDQFSQALSAALSRLPGTGVIYVADARPLGFALGNEPLHMGPAPVLVAGEFRSDDSGQGRPTIEVKLRAGGDLPEVKSSGLGAAETIQWLRTTAVDKLAKVAAKPALDGETEAKALTARAERYRDLGDFRGAIALNELALLFQPANTELRAKLVGDITSSFLQLKVLEPGDANPGSPAMKRQFGPRTDLYLRSLEHLENLIVAQRIPRESAIALVAANERAFLFHYHRTVVVVGNGEYYCIGQEELVRAQKPRRRFFLEVFSKVFQLPVGPEEKAGRKTKYEVYAAWVGSLIANVGSRTDVPYLIPKDLQDMKRVYTEILPDGLTGAEFALPRYSTRRELGPRHATPEDFESFYHELAASDRPATACCGKHALLLLRIGGDKLSTEEADELRRQIDEYGKELHSSPRVAGVPSPQNFERSCIGDLKSRVARLEPRPEIKRPARPPVEEKLTTGAVRFQPIDWQITEIDGKSHWPNKPECAALLDPWAYLVPVNKQVDCFWTIKGVFLIRAPRLLEAVVARDEDLRVWDVKVSDERLWVASRPTMVRLIDIRGKTLATAHNQDGLPPSDEIMLVYPTSGKRALVFGSLGNPPRAWGATVEWTGGDRLKVKVFFEAKRALAANDKPDQADPALDVGFHVHRSFEYHPADANDKPLLLVARGKSLPLLQVDPRTLAVAAFAHPESGLRVTSMQISRDGWIIGPENGSLRQYAPAGKPWPDGSMARSIPLRNPLPPDRKRQGAEDLRRAREVFCNTYDRGISNAVLDGDLLYYPTGYWYRINLDSMQAERLNSTVMPSEFAKCRGLGKSIHHGLVVANKDTFYTMSVDESAIPKAASAPGQ